MSSRQLEEIEEEELTLKVAGELGITSDELEELNWYIDSWESNDGQICSILIRFRDGSPKHILNKIEAMDDNNTVYLDPWVFDKPDDADYDRQYVLTEFEVNIIDMLYKEFLGDK